MVVSNKKKAYLDNFSHSRLHTAPPATPLIKRAERIVYEEKEPNSGLRMKKNVPKKNNNNNLYMF